VHALGATLLIARLANALGLSRSLGPTPPQAGAALTLLVVVAASLLIFYRLVAARMTRRFNARRIGCDRRRRPELVCPAGQRGARRARTPSRTLSGKKPRRAPAGTRR
jgi:hypothetical protein